VKPILRDLAVRTLLGAGVLGYFAVGAQACSAADRRAAAPFAAIGVQLGCALSSAFDGPDVIAILCPAAAKMVTDFLAPAGALRIGEKHMPPACVWTPLHPEAPDGQLVCEARRADVLRALGGAK
jgi:hypothetical protein